MAKITIFNTKEAIESSEKLIACANQLDSVRINIQDILQEIKLYWEQSQQDAQTFATNLEGHAKFIGEFAVNSKDLASVVTKYAKKQEQTSSNTIY